MQLRNGIFFVLRIGERTFQKPRKLTQNFVDKKTVQTSQNYLLPREKHSRKEKKNETADTRHQLMPDRHTFKIEF
jgi:hypothetical protein